MKSGSLQALILSALFGLLAGGAGAAEVCDEFPEVHAHWLTRIPKCGASASLTERDGYLRLQVPDGVTASGDFDSWAGADRAPTFERTDMGSGDWIISTRLEFETPPLGTTYHTGLMFAFGPPSQNDVVYWGEYTGNGVLAVERVGNGIRPLITLDPPPGPISLQVEKAGDTYHFRHRLDDGDPWTDDKSLTTEMASTQPVTKVGLITKAWGGTGSPQVISDFDYFCLSVPGNLPADVVTDPIPVASPVESLSCEKQPGGSLALTWSICPDASSPITVKIAGEVVSNLPAAAREITISPPFPGGSIINVEVDNGFGTPARCTLADVLREECDEFDEDPTAGDIWTFRTPKVTATGPTISVDENPGFLRFFVPDGGAAGGPFDSWVNADFAPTLERYDMGEKDWEITTRLSYSEEFPAPPVTHHVGLMFGYGLGPPNDSFNDVTYWGEYHTPNTLRVERVGAALTAMLPYPGAPVSLQIKKNGDVYTFSHRSEDTEPWIGDGSYTVQLPFPANAAASPPAGTPVARVGLIIKTWGGGPEVTADFDYFCLKISDSPPTAVLEAAPLSGSAPLQVNFSGLNSEDPSGGTLTYAWDFGDGATGTGGEVSHTYTKGGIVTATLTVTDDQKNSGQTSTTIYVSDPVAPFQYVRLGTLGQNGLVRVDDTGGKRAYCLLAGGTTLNLSTDHAFFLEQKLSGDFTVDAKVNSADLSGGTARAGLMARLSNDARSPNAFMSIDSQNDGYQFQFRRLEGGAIARPSPNPVVSPPRGDLPAWLRLQRQGSVFIGYYSTDGTTFTEYARQDLPSLNVADLEVGFAATSGTESRAAEFCVELSGFPTGSTLPAKPTGLTATKGDAQVTLDWNNNPEGPPIGYNLYRSEAGGAFAKVNGAPLLDSSFVDTGRTNGVEYCYRVRAVNPAGESPDSDTACATPGAIDGVQFKRGDIDGNNLIDISDPVGLLGSLFLGTGAPACLEAGDFDDNGALDITDAVNNLGYQFLGTGPPAAPGVNCGPDGNPPFLGCGTSPCN